ncbi:MAG: UbiX family flavin prenyltransferase [Chitinophagaceae bacterium]|nr:UbiX family flavin prenyltransferase [Chitinophagaceae bacterium]
MQTKKIAIAVTGASGAVYAKVLLQKLTAHPNLELSLVMSDNARDVWQFELGTDDYLHFPVRRFELHDYFAPFASGSSEYEALVICPCSMGTLGRIANGVSDNLISRAADVMLKERRKLICVVRDTPYNLIHINNMKVITEAGGIICPASPSFYSKPKDFDELAATVVDRVIGLLGLPQRTYRWGQSE